ncbi:phosphotransferase enzyme family protein [Paenibacillus sp. FSL H7-0331]|uniref:phosphotransferase enzyme family protein n=1 Tax=Paenibacillus sp. FSL H7-0331 TaxID=1920421 RepID=UPI00096D548F|nr:phosphotransferase [Paenibacillus sp. FSL H7-0331]OMF20057.1 hypothetical protein BK127_03990 [Paenibacillus sp. FSL H7-0331]
MRTTTNQIDAKVILDAGSRFTEANTRFIPLESFESSVYVWADRGKRYVLKIIDRQHRTEAEILGEIDFVHFAADHGVSVARAIVSLNGSYVESIGDHSKDGYWAYAMEWVEGQPANPEVWGPELFQQWGQLLGKLHQVTSQYKPSRPEWKRHRWDEDELYHAALLKVAADPLLGKALNPCLLSLKQLPEHPDQFGLIHNDLHHRNFHVHKGRMIVFDFDGMVYHHYASDIAVAMYYAIDGDRSTADKASFAKLFMHHVLEGYSHHQTVSKALVQSAPDWMLLRHLLLYTTFLRKWEGMNRNTMQRWTLNRYRTDLSMGKLFGGIELDYTNWI